ncbi:Glutathione S-transferase [Trichoplax sp. H2]|uniref:glutathione transferase n=1 Tax=Trichoplax adhaerens TaxID=10228 RepID=B3RU72_TRIAD|nr:hypothetical protein TRIADDRAFT_55179 [Trichoplax adhaerens]EDV25288.1 hypothetical protein TRIADDRAFT_55179 [Trichoplax adhaerens]RDD46027.1 Glutathione S-transferase [Trichoplax sp. H2]|eukprot:XP_002111321.1 hypothetical protein TRIADDRAFT_55179 [Trichoplax adhaerens]
MPKYILHYLDIDARAELIRLILAYDDIHFKEILYSFEEWPTVKEKFPYETVPVLVMDGKEVAQSGAITRYLARVAGINGKTTTEKAMADMYVDTFIYDIVEKSYSFRLPALEPDEEKRKEKAQEFLKEKLIPFLDQLEELYKKNGGGPWFCGETFTYADLAYFRMVNNVHDLVMQVPTPHPHLQENYERTANIPRIAEYQKNKKQDRII